MANRLLMVPLMVPPFPSLCSGSQPPSHHSPSVSTDWGTTSTRTCVWVPQSNYLLFHEWVRMPNWDLPYWGSHRTGMP